MRHFLLILTTMLFACCSSDNETQAETLQNTSGMTMNITIGGVTQTVTLADNAATQALVAKLKDSPITLSLNTNEDFEIWAHLASPCPQTMNTSRDNLVTSFSIVAVISVSSMARTPTAIPAWGGLKD